MPGLYRGGGKKCYGFAANRFTFPERTGEGYRQNGRRAENAIPPRGKVLRFHGKSIHFPKNNISWSNRKSLNLHKRL